ncbi:putative transcription factor C2H2 family [Lupinus albus]|uniref:Putative transcription factor C2H2 family n=1 Tax=Lupinus albus TaxID=3870 RepID=A0A6A4QQ50_LUPAL|nr:putative transcription factor C2H2 family [Lupinus albus]
MSSSSSPPPTTYLINLSYGYSIAIALLFLFLFSIIIIFFYLFLRILSIQNSNRNNNNSNDIVLSRIIFMAEDNEENQNGLEQNVINSYPKFEYSKDVGHDVTCSICLCDYKDSEMLRMMPECRHYFHLCCLDSWLKLNGSCPFCRN